MNQQDPIHGWRQDRHIRYGRDNAGIKEDDIKALFPAFE